MQYLNKSFSVYANYGSEPKCSRCMREIKVGYCTKGGYLCGNCYNQEKRYKDVEKIKKEIKKKISELQQPDNT